MVQASVADLTQVADRDVSIVEPIQRGLMVDDG